MSGQIGADPTNSKLSAASPEFLSLIDNAWQVRTANFPMEITQVNPVKTQAVSVTGTDCALNCAHCGRHYLKGMQPLDAVLEKQNSQKVSSYLISGGSTLQGNVPLLPFVRQLQSLKPKARLNLHTGLVSREEALALAGVADAVSFDFPVSSDIIKYVYGLDRELSDYVTSYRILAECLGEKNVIPHITIGLMKGQISSEIQAAKILADQGVKNLVLLVFIPTPGTRFGSMVPPNLLETVKVIAQIRILLPETEINLGCMRPGGKYRLALDELAVKCGINKIVNPSKAFTQWARELQLEILLEEECCVL